MLLRKLSVLCISLFCLFSLNACTLGLSYAILEDERPLLTILDDQAITVAVKGQLLEKDPFKASDINVYCFYGQVFLVGYVDREFQLFAKNIATNTEDVQFVHTHWYSEESLSTEDDIEARIEVQVSLLAALDIPATQVEYEVHNREVVVLGVVSSEKIAKRVVSLLQDLVGVSSVTSYLMIDG